MQILKKIIVFILTIESRLILKKYKPYIIAVTGSVGKTATKDAIFCALSGSGFVRKSEKSMNSEFGLPLTIIGAPTAWRSIQGWMQNIYKGASLIFKHVEYPKILVLEIGADHPDDIRKVTKWLHPDVSVLTKVGDKPVHVEFFKSPEHVFEEKSYLIKAVKPNGTIVVFADEPKIVQLGKDVVEKDPLKNIKLVTFGLSEQATIRGADYQVVYDDSHLPLHLPKGFSFNMSFANLASDNGPKTININVDKILGSTFIYPLLAATAVAQSRDMNIDTIVKNLSTYKAPKGRMNIIAGKNDSILIDDTYNSSPDAVEAALDTLKSLECSGKKIAVLGDMLELGQYSAEEHRRVGNKVPDVAQVLVVVGPRSEATKEAALAKGMSSDNVHVFGSSTEAGEALSHMVVSGDIVLIKGSQSIRMERVTMALMKEPSKSSELLVRQEKEWLEKK